MNDRELQTLRVEVDYRFDACGRMVESFEPHPAARTPAPLATFARTRDGDVIRFGTALNEYLVARLKDILEGLPAVSTIGFPLEGADHLHAKIASEHPIAHEGGGPAYLFPDVIESRLPVVSLTASNRDLAKETFPWLYEEVEDWWPCRAVVRDGAAVSVCFSSRRGERAAEAGLRTLEGYQGRGFAAAVTACWAAAVRISGRIPFYSTSWDNIASQGVARSLGLRLFSGDVSWK